MFDPRKLVTFRSRMVQLSPFPWVIAAVVFSLFLFVLRKD